MFGFLRNHKERPFLGAGTGSFSAVAVEGVSKSFPRRQRFGIPRVGAFQPLALSNVSLTVEEGEMVGLLGPNGAGKTTLLKIIGTMLYPNSGRVLLHGQDVIEHPVKARGKIGLVTCDERSFYWRLTGRHNLSFFAALYGIPREKANERIALLLDILGLSEAAEQPFYSYSSGMKQKLAIARGILSDPSILLYDEPTRSLDPLSAQNIRKWIVTNRAKSARTTHVIATNQLHEAEQLCDRVIIINRGVIIASGTIDEIRQRWLKREFTVQRITCRSFVLTEHLLPGPVEGLLEISEESREGDQVMLRTRTLNGSNALSIVLNLILQSGGTILRCEAEKVPFDEVFCGLVMGNHEKAGPLGREDI